jgi:hypothetical protein
VDGGRFVLITAHLSTRRPQTSCTYVLGTTGADGCPCNAHTWELPLQAKIAVSALNILAGVSFMNTRYGKQRRCSYQPCVLYEHSPLRAGVRARITNATLRADIIEQQALGQRTRDFGMAYVDVDASKERAITLNEDVQCLDGRGRTIHKWCQQ